MNNRLTAAMPAKTLRLLPRVRHEAEQRLFNRELSLLEFFRQVLDEALDVQAPLLERLRFLTIFSSIVDEFFMVRVSGLKEEMEQGWGQPSPDGMTAQDQLREARDRLRPMIAEYSRALTKDILPELERNGIVIAPYESVTADQRRGLDNYFTRNVFPVLTPLAVDPAHPLPYISGLSLNLGLTVHLPQAPATTKSEARFVRIKVPPVLPGLVPIGESKFVFLSDLIASNLGSLFPGMRAGAAHTFRVTRDADIEIRDDEADDLLRALQRGLRQRRFGTPVRLEVASAMPDEMLDYLTNSLGLESDDIYRVDARLLPAPLPRPCYRRTSPQ